MPRRNRHPYAELPRPTGLFLPDNIRARTAEMRQHYPPAPTEPEPEPLTPEQQQLQSMSEYIAENFGCHADATRELVGMILKQELPKPAQSEVMSSNSRPEPNPWVPGALVALDAERSLALIDCTDVDGDAIFYRASEGTLIPDRYIDERRIGVDVATEEEINTFLREAGLA